MVNATALANGATTTVVIAYVIAVLLSYVAPGFMFALSTSWFEALNVSVARAIVPIPLDTALLGLISIGVVSWLWVYSTAAAYNFFSRPVGARTAVGTTAHARM